MQAVLCAVIVGFNPAPCLPRKRNVMARSVHVTMQAPPPEKSYDDAASEEAASGYEEFYDDEKPMVEKPPISAEMREKLLKGQQVLGSDPNRKNPFLLVFAGVGLFVILGAIAVNL
jgi:hypothetical protein